MTATAPVFTFTEADHRYTVDGIEFPSITTVIDAMGLVDYSSVPDADLKFAMQRGTAAHRACWYDDDGDLNPASVDDEVLPYLEAWRKFRRDLPFEILLSEARRYDKVYRYAGTPDRYVKFPDGHRGVIELKSGPIQPAAAIQTAAQARLLDLQCEQLKRFAIHLKADGNYALKEFPRSEMQRDLATFICALNLHVWRKENL